MAKTYWEKLQDPRWQKKRLEIMQRDEFKCSRCNRDDVTLSVHHRIYRKKCEPWEYGDEDLTTLCKPCHEAVTDQDSKIKEWLSGDENRLFILRLIDLETCGYPNVEIAMWEVQQLVTHYLSWVFREDLKLIDAFELSSIMREVALAIDGAIISLESVQHSIRTKVESVRPDMKPVEPAKIEAISIPEDSDQPF
jgi:hypothetical protein